MFASRGSPTSERLIVLIDPSRGTCVGHDRVIVFPNISHQATRWLIRLFRKNGSEGSGCCLSLVGGAIMILEHLLHCPVDVQCYGRQLVAGLEWQRIQWNGFGSIGANRNHTLSSANTRILNCIFQLVYILQISSTLW